MMQPQTKTIRLSESTYRRIVREEILRENLRLELLKEGFTNEEIEHLLEFDWRSLKAAGSALVGGAKDAYKKGSEVATKLKTKAGEKIGAAKQNINTKLQQKYKEALKADVEKALTGIDRKYFNDNVIKKAGLEEEDVENIQQALKNFQIAIESLLTAKNTTKPAEEKV